MMSAKLIDNGGISMRAYGQRIRASGYGFGMALSLKQAANAISDLKDLLSGATKTIQWGNAALEMVEDTLFMRSLANKPSHQSFSRHAAITFIKQCGEVLRRQEEIAVAPTAR
jgi:hypothetical protein